MENAKYIPYLMLSYVAVRVQKIYCRTDTVTLTYIKKKKFSHFYWWGWLATLTKPFGGGRPPFDEPSGVVMPTPNAIRWSWPPDLPDPGVMATS